MKQYNLRLQDNLAAAINELTNKDRRTLNTTFTIAIEEYLISRGVKVSELAAEVAPQISPISPPSSEAKPVKVDSKPTSNGAQMSTEQKPSSTSAAVPAWKQRVLDKQSAKQYTKLEQKPPVIEQQALIESNISEEPIDLDSF